MVKKNLEKKDLVKKDLIKKNLIKMHLERIKKYIWLYTGFLIYSLSSVCAKCASAQTVLLKFLFFLAMEIGCLVFYAVVWQQVLKRFTLVTAMACKGIVVIFNLIWAVLLFQEKLGMCHVAGAVVILTGIRMVSADG